MMNKKIKFIAYVLCMIVSILLCVVSCGENSAYSDTQTDMPFDTTIQTDTNSNLDTDVDTDVDTENERKMVINCHNDGQTTTYTIASKTNNYVSPITKKGHSFLGYFTENGEQYFGADGHQIFDTTIENDIDLYTKFEPYKFVIELNAQAGYFEDNTTVKEIMVEYGENLDDILPYALNVSPKFEFDGWFDENGNVRYSNGTVSTFSLENLKNNSTIKMFAKFKTKEFKVTLNYNDGVTASAVINVKYGEQINNLSNYTLDNGTHEITGWSLSYNGEQPLPESVLEDMVIYAIWTEYKTIEFVYPNDKVNVKFYETQKEISNLPFEEQIGYEFGGWYVETTLTGDSISSTTYDSLSDIYYGKWELIDYKLTFNSGTNEKFEEVIYNYGATNQLPTPEKEGYAFGQYH